MKIITIVGIVLAVFVGLFVAYIVIGQLFYMLFRILNR